MVEAEALALLRVRRRPAPSKLRPASERGRRRAREAGAAALARRRLSVEEGELVLSLALRREQLDLPVRVELFRRLATHIQARLDEKKPPSLSDENYLLQVASALAGDEPARVRAGPAGA